MRCARWLRLQRGVDPLPDPDRIVAGFAAAAGRDLPDAANTVSPHAPAPQRDGASMDSQLRGARLRCLAGGRCDNDPRTPPHLLWRRTGPDPLFQADYLRIRQNDRQTFS